MKTLYRLIIAMMVFVAYGAGVAVAAPAAQSVEKNVVVIVSDDMGPVIGAVVMLKGTTTGVVTDLDGKAVFNSLPKDAVFEVSCLGYIPQEVKADKQTVQVTLLTDAHVLDDVVVIGASEGCEYC